MDRVIGLRDGRVIYDGDHDGFADLTLLKRLYDLDFTIGSHPNTGEPLILPGDRG